MLMKDYAKAEKTRDGTKKTLKEHVSITTPVGSFTIRLKPEWHRKSVEYLTDLAETETRVKVQVVSYIEWNQDF